MLYVRPSRIMQKTEWQTIYKRFSFRTIHKMIDCNMPCTVHCSELKGITDVSSVAMIAVAATTTTNCHIERYIRTRIAEFTFALRSAGEWNESLSCVSLHSRFSPFFPLHFTRAHYYRSLHTVALQALEIVTPNSIAINCVLSTIAQNEKMLHWIIKFYCLALTQMITEIAPANREYYITQEHCLRYI